MHSPIPEILPLRPGIPERWVRRETSEPPGFGKEKDQATKGLLLLYVGAAFLWPERSRKGR